MSLKGSKSQFNTKIPKLLFIFDTRFGKVSAFQEVITKKYKQIILVMQSYLKCF